MDLRRSVGRVAVVAAVLGLAPRARAQEGAGPPIPKPTAEHKILAAEEGTWDAVVKTYMGGPDAEPAVSKGTEVNTVMTGGLWVVSQFKGDFGGTPFEGRGQFGYDPLKKKYVGTWVDSMMTTFARSEGHYDAATLTLSFETQAMHEGSLRRYREVTETRADGSQLYRHLTAMPDGTQFEMIRIEYRRRAP